MESSIDALISPFPNVHFDRNFKPPDLLDTSNPSVRRRLLGSPFFENI